MPQVAWRFSVVGAQDVQQAYKGIRVAALQAGQAAVQTHARVARVAKSTEEQRWRDVQAAGRKIEREFARESAMKARAEERAAKHVSGIRERHFRDEQRRQERATRDQERAAKHVNSIRDRYFREEQRRQEALARVQERAANRVSASRMRSLGRVGDLAMQAGLGMAAAGLGASAGLVGGAARDSMRLREVAGRMAINARAAGEAATNPLALQRTFESVALATPGIKSADIGQAAMTFQSRTGKILGEGQLQTLATAASASGAEINDLADAMAALSLHTGVSTMQDFQTVLSDLISQGARGSFELKDAAANYRELASAAGMFGIGKGPEAVRTLGGLTQIAMTGSGSPEEATTSLRNLFLKLGTEGETLRTKYGVNVYDKTGKARAVPDILLETIAKAGGTDPGKKNAELTKLFDIRAIKAIGPLVQAFNDATRDGKDGLAAMRAKVDDATKASGTWEDRQREAAIAQQMSSARLTAAWESVVSSVTAKLTPTLVELIGKFSRLVTDTDAVDKLVTVFVALAEAGELAADGLRFLGLLKPKVETPEQQIKRKEVELAALLEQEGRGDLTPDQALRAATLQGEIRQLKQGGPDADEGAASNASKVFRTLTRDEFIEQAGREYERVYGLSGGREGDARRLAAEQAASIESNPGMVGRISPANAELASLLQGFAESIVSAQTRVKDDDVPAVTPDFDGLAAAAAGAAAKLNEIGAPSNI